MKEGSLSLCSVVFCSALLLFGLVWSGLFWSVLNSSELFCSVPSFPSACLPPPFPLTLNVELPHLLKGLLQSRVLTLQTGHLF